MEKPYRRMIRALKERDGADAVAEAAADERAWSVYIVRCGDDSLYTGIAKDVDARLTLHNAGRGAAYTRARRPVTLVYRASGMTRSEALVEEARIKALPRAVKRALAEG